MPVVLDPALATEWLTGNDELIGPGAPQSPPLVAWPVDKRVNNARNDGEDLAMIDTLWVRFVIFMAVYVAVTILVDRTLANYGKNR